MEKMVPPCFSVVFVSIFLILAGNKDMHKSLGEFGFLSDRVIDYFLFPKFTF